jgi:RimJ/RimL family protein N-acetyltransferase
MGAIEPGDLTAGPLRLRPWRADDVDAVLAVQRDDAALRLWAGGVTDRPEAEALLRRLMFQENRASWAVTDSSAELLGGISLHSVDVVQNDASIGYWTAPAARGRGVAAAAVDAACRWAFAELPVDRIELCHAVENRASGRVAEKAGFTYEGRLRRSFRYGDGIKHDELLWGRLAADPPPEGRSAPWSP